MTRAVRFAGIVVSVGTVLAAGSASMDAATFSSLGYLAGNQSGCKPAAISNDGSTIIGTWYQYYGSGGLIDEGQAFRWTHGNGFEVLGPGAPSVAIGMSADGSVVVGSHGRSSYPTPFRWTKSGGVQVLPLLPNMLYGEVTGVSADGSVIVGMNHDYNYNQNSYLVNGVYFSDMYAFRWTAQSGTQRISAEFKSRAMGVSADGNVVIGQTSTGTKEFRDGAWRTVSEGNEPYATRWKNGQPGLVPLRGLTVVSADGSVIAGITQQDTNGRYNAAVWTEERGTTVIGLLSSQDFCAFPASMSADGSVVIGTSGWYQSNDPVFIWDAAHGMRLLQDALTQEYQLDLGGAHILNAVISANGRYIAGEAYDLPGVIGTSVWVADLATENPVPGDFTGDGVVDAADLTEMSQALYAGSTELKYDLNYDQVVDSADFAHLLHDLLGTTMGDADLSGAVDIDDYYIFIDGWYFGGNSWDTGDFDGNGAVDIDDYYIFIDGWYGL